MKNENQNDPDTSTLDVEALQPRTTASSGQSCEQCTRPLTGRKERFCSDRCRMRHQRDRDRRKRSELLDALSAAVEQLRREVLR